MLESVALLLASALAASVPPAKTQNLVEICSLVAGTCHSLPAATLDPSSRPAVSAGQLAFVDAETGALVTPTVEQAEELAERIALSEEQKSAAEPVFLTLPNGTVRARGDFRVYLRAETGAPAPEHKP